MENSWLFPAVEAAHLVGMALLIGCIARSDSRVWQGGRAIHEPWLIRGLGIMLLTGPLMLAANPSRYAANAAFQWKLAILAIALAFHFLVRRRHANRVTATCSFLLWTAVVFAARAIADFDL